MSESAAPESRGCRHDLEAEDGPAVGGVGRAHHPLHRDPEARRRRLRGQLERGQGRL